MLDALQIIFWSITYILIIIAGFQNSHDKKASIPCLAIVQNLAWEAAALVHSRGFWGHILWFLLDLIIFFLVMHFLFSQKHRYLCISGVIVLFFGFYNIFFLPEGMLYSSFVIDLLMAVYFLVDRKKLSPKLKLPIAITKLTGDAFAGLYYAPDSNFVAILAGLVFVCNLCYLYLCLEESRSSAERKTKKNR